MRIEKKATIVSTSVAAVLVIIKMTFGILSGSVAVLASAIDSLLDLSVSAFNYFALHNAEKPADDKFNFGRTKIEPLAAVIEGTIISVSALFIFYQAISNIVNTKELSHLDESAVVMFISIVLTGFLVLFLNHIAKKTNNMVIRADALHYKTDLFSNGAVLLAIFLVSFTGEALIDSILGIAIAVYMIVSAYPIIKDGVLMLLDAALEEEEVNKIHALLKTDKEITDYHYLLTRQSGSDIFISVHVVFNVTITLFDAHIITDRLEVEIEQLFPENSVQIIIHMDPYDDSEIEE
ncbi:MAG: cation diffusion facilitator family transporter [Campylobacterota bacterium]|nr:cation diffusion facilitator family transporter [Campylobacterota bacterium]